MIEPPKGTKQQVLGGVLAGLGTLIALLSQTIGFELDPFYGVIGVIGAGLLLHGTMRKGPDGKQHPVCREAGSRAKHRR